MRRVAHHEHLRHGRRKLVLFRARGRQGLARGLHFRVGRHEQLGELRRGRRNGTLFVLEERHFDRRQITIEYLELVDAAANRRLLAEPRAERQSQERIEHVAGRERQDRARKVIVLDVRHRGGAVHVQLEPGRAARAVVRQREVRPRADRQRIVGLDRDHVRRWRVCERRPQLAVVDREPVTRAARILLRQVVQHRRVLVLRAHIEPEVDAERIRAVVPADVAPEKAAIRLVEEQRLAAHAGFKDG